MNPRLAATHALNQIIAQGRNLSDALEPLLSRMASARDRALLQAMTYGVMRAYWRLDALLQQLLQKPLKAKDNDIRMALLLGLNQLIYMRIPEHAAVDETVRLAPALKKPWARGLINGVLRRFLRQRTELLAKIDQDDACRTAHPPWLLAQLQQDWPDDWEAIAAANNEPPPMTLRVNARQHSRDAYHARLTAAGIEAEPALHTEWGLTLAKPVDVSELPGFNAGSVSVQDAAAQLAAPLLSPQAGERILDACAAPGGKSAHLLEQQPGLAELVALDISAERLDKVKQNLARLGLRATMLAGDASDPSGWWDGAPFDRILLDAPCSATGVIRRHPDIKVLRRAGDIPALIRKQQQILCALWPLLKPGGMLLYATCSVLQQENTHQLDTFLTAHNGARLLPIEAPWGRATRTGRQILPGEEGMDGFFYALIRKT